MRALSVLFPAFCHGLREPDPEFQREAEALENLGIPWHVVNISALNSGDLASAFRYFGEAPLSPMIYRGWILHPEEFTALHEALLQRGCQLLTSPAAYRCALLFPEFFPAIADYSFPAVWITGKDPNQAIKIARQLGSGPYFIKDFAKSAKEIWPNGCVATNEQELPTAIQALVEYRGDRFEGGIVIRPLIRLRCLDQNPFGGKIFEEYRLFFFQGRLISKTAYDRVSGDAAALPDYGFLSQRIHSTFFSADVVMTESGQPYLLKAGDGGSSALPPYASPMDFYKAILNVLAPA
ncbi:MAG: ATP-grasp domain-containing protein [Verrucomicrobiae bacterium]|nr:ATP-grasp domain-containing protein [Verrucomicrobiae bacterium]